MDETAKISPRRGWLALLLSLVTTGLGQFYNGQWKKGLVLLVMQFGLGALVYSSAYKTMLSFALCLVSMAAIGLFSMIDAWLNARKLQEYPLSAVNRWWVYLLVVVLNAGAGWTADVVGQGRTAQNYKIPSESMVPTLLVGDYLMAEPVTPKTRLHRGDVVTFVVSGDGRTFIKRIVGMPGETVAIRDKSVFIDGRLLPEPYAYHNSLLDIPDRDNFGPIRLGPEEFFCMGDNREKSFDSRWMGPVLRQDVTARALYIYMPGLADGERTWNRMGQMLN